jgi:hypothetical protein
MRTIKLHVELDDEVYRELAAAARTKVRPISKEAARRIAVCPFLEDKFRALEEWAEGGRAKAARQEPGERGADAKRG